jgi:membrane-associated phospholipid phosphatase
MMTGCRFPPAESWQLRRFTAGGRATGIARTRSGPRWVCPTLPPDCLPDGATFTIQLHVRTVNPQTRLVYRLSVPRRAVLNRRALWYATAFVALAVLVDITDFDRVNSFAVNNLQPLAGGNGRPQMRDWTEVLISPAGPMITALVIAAAAICLLARRQTRAAAAWPAALGLALVVEIVCKLVVGQHRSGIWHGFGLTFDSSFPSGHMLRAILITGAVAAVIPALRLGLGLWCVAVAVCLLINGWHLPTDIAGGILAGMALYYFAQAFSLTPRTAASPSSSSSSPYPGTVAPVPDRPGTYGSRSR